MRMSSRERKTANWKLDHQNLIMFQYRIAIHYKKPYNFLKILCTFEVTELLLQQLCISPSVTLQWYSNNIKIPKNFPKHFLYVAEILFNGSKGLILNLKSWNDYEGWNIYKVKKTKEPKVKKAQKAWKAEKPKNSKNLSRLST